MAIVILGGLVTSTLLNLLVLPTAGGALRKVWRQRAGLIRRKNQTHSRRILENAA